MLAESLPRDDVREALGDLVHRLGVEGGSCVGFFGRGMGAAANGFVEEFEGPVGSRVAGAAVVGVVVEQGRSGMGQGRTGRRHEAANGAMVLTLSGSESLSERGMSGGHCWFGVFEAVGQRRRRGEVAFLVGLYALHIAGVRNLRPRRISDVERTREHLVYC
jgi:hypothetical protein